MAQGNEVGKNDMMNHSFACERVYWSILLPFTSFSWIKQLLIEAVPFGKFKGMKILLYTRLQYNNKVLIYDFENLIVLMSWKIVWKFKFVDKSKRCSRKGGGRYHQKFFQLPDPSEKWLQWTLKSIVEFWLNFHYCLCLTSSWHTCEEVFECVYLYEIFYVERFFHKLYYSWRARKNEKKNQPLSAGRNRGEANSVDLLSANISAIIDSPSFAWPS